MNELSSPLSDRTNRFCSPLVVAPTGGRRRPSVLAGGGVGGVGGAGVGVGGASGAGGVVQKSQSRKLLLKEKSKSDSFFNTSLSPSHQEEIIKALEASWEHATASQHDDAQRLVGDLSRKHSLPILRVSKHNDLASISANTLVDLIDGKYSEHISEYTILDARYPYEYAGGHITGAENAFSLEEIFEKLFKNAKLCSKPRVLIFHCEFSSERGPRL